MKKTPYFLGAMLLLIITLPLFFLSSQNREEIRQRAAVLGFPHVQGAQIMDSSGKPVLLRGAMMESSFAYINRWNKGEDPTTTLNSTTFGVMHSWNMNALRINISQWIYNLNPTLYMQRLDKVITQANQVGLYVIVDFHNDGQSGATKPGGYLYPENVLWWKTIAAHYKNNPMILFDLINEPNYPDWNTWLNGGTFTDSTTDQAVTVVGIPAVIAAIRSVGAAQMIVVEPGAGGGKAGGWNGFTTSLSDQNIIFSKHDYAKVISGNPSQWDAEWGTILNHHPIYYGEWAVLANPYWPSHCTGLTSANADQVIAVFLQYLQSRNASWTYWDFKPYELIQDYTSFAPTSFQTGAPWACPNGGKAGAGNDLKNFLTHATGLPTPTPTKSPTATPVPTKKVTPTPTTTIPFAKKFVLTIFLDGLGSAGDRSNAHGLGNLHPNHPVRVATIEIDNASGAQVTNASGNIVFAQSSGNFTGTIGTNYQFSANTTYSVKLRVGGYLQKKLPGILPLTQYATFVFPPVSLVAGDVNNDNKLDILDYNLIMGCYTDLLPAAHCLAADKSASDITDDGVVNQFDYNLFVREIGNQFGG